MSSITARVKQNLVGAFNHSEVQLPLVMSQRVDFFFSHFKTNINRLSIYLSNIYLSIYDKNISIPLTLDLLSSPGSTV